LPAARLRERAFFLGARDMTEAPQKPAEYATEGEYMAAEKARYATQEPPQTPPIYPLSPASAKARAYHALTLAQRVPPTLPTLIDPQRPAEPAARALTDEDALRIYPQTINADFLAPMTQVIEDALASGDMEGVYRYAAWIPQEIGIGLAKRAHAYAGDLPPDPPPLVLTTITGSVVTDNSPADSASVNTVQFTATDQNGAGMVAALVFTCDSQTAPLTPASASTAPDGSFSVDLIDSVAETVTVTATSGSVSGAASVTFTAPAGS
jgi:adhesin/invasin